MWVHHCLLSLLYSMLCIHICCNVYNMRMYGYEHKYQCILCSRHLYRVIGSAVVINMTVQIHTNVQWMRG